MTWLGPLQRPACRLATGTTGPAPGTEGIGNAGLAGLGAGKGVGTATYNRCAAVALVNASSKRSTRASSWGRDDNIESVER